MNQNLRIEILLEEIVRKNASDLHLQVGLPPMMRLDGVLTAFPGYNPLNAEEVERLVFAILDDDQRIRLFFRFWRSWSFSCECFS